MFRFLIISLLICGSCYSQDSLVVNDGSIWFTRSSCAVDVRCFDNLDDLVASNCSDSLTIVSIQLLENEYEKSEKNSYAECRAQKLADYFELKHNIHVSSVTASSILLDAEEMRTAIAQNNFRTVVLVLGAPMKTEF